MKPIFKATFFFATLLLLAMRTSVQAQELDSKLPPPLIPRSELKIDVLFWMADCEQYTQDATECSLPRAIDGQPRQNFSIPIESVEGFGQVARSHLDHNEGLVKLSVDVYSVAPGEGSTLPPYVQIQIELKSPARAICMQSVRWKDPFEMPTLICAGYQTTGSLKKWGVSVSQTRE